jgi:hypothetical protein
MATTINNAKGAKTPFRIRSNACGQLCWDADNSLFRPTNDLILGAKWLGGDATLDGHPSMHSEKDTRKANAETML